MSIIISVFESLVVSGVDRLIAEKWKDKKRDKQLQEAYNAWLENEKSHMHYNALDRALSNSNIIGEFIASVCCPEKNFTMKSRIEDLFRHDNFTTEEKTHISHSVETLLNTFNTILQAVDDRDTTLLISRIDNNTEKIIKRFNEFEAKEPTVSPISLSIIEGETVPEKSTIIPRKIFSNIEGYSTQDKKEYFPPMDIISKKKKILIISEAGYGKTYLLYQIYHDAKEKGYHALYFSLKHNSFPNVLNLLESKQICVNCKSVLILDGLDEVKAETRNHIITTLQSIISCYPDLFIIVSMRTNFYTSIIDGIEAYEIKPFDDNDRREYIQTQGIDYDSFMNSIIEQQLYDVYQNAFYFTELVRMWQDNEKLPNCTVLMEKITESRICADIGKFKNVIPSPERRIKKYFQSISLIMQCMQVYTLSHQQMEKVIDEDLLFFLNYNGLMECINGQWSFTHNNFKEYFTALALSKLDLAHIKRYISETIDGEEYIRPSWYNVLSFLLLRDKNRDLLDWVLSIQPDIIINLEREQFSLQQRTDIYIRIMEVYKDSHQWFMDYSSRRKLAILCANENTVEYIIEELKGNTSCRQKQNLLRSLEYFDTFYNKEHDVKEIVTAIIFNTELPMFLRIDAINVVEEHTSVFEDKSEAIIKLFRDDMDENMTYAVLKIIDAYGKSEQQLDSIIKAYEKYDRLKNHLISLSLLYNKILQGITTKDAACKILSFIIAHPDRMEDDDCKKIFTVCCEIGAQHYSGSNDEFLKYIKAILHVDLFYYFHNTCTAIIKYINATHTESSIYSHIASSNNKYDIPYLVSFILCDTLIQYIINEYKQGKIDNEIIKELISRTYGKENYNKALKIALLRKTGETITEPPTYENVKEAESLGHQLYFNALFDKEQYALLMNRLSELFGRDCTIGSVKAYEYHVQFRKEPVLRDAYYGLRYILGESKDTTTFPNVMSKIQSWDIFLIYAVDSVLSNHIKEVSVSEEQKEKIKQAVINILTPNMLNITTKNGIQYSYPLLLPPCLRVIRILDLDCPEEIVVRLLLVPFHIWDKEEQHSIPKYITSHLPHEKLIKYVIESMKNNTWSAIIVPHFINFCIDNNITAVKQNIIEVLFDSERNLFGINTGLEYLCKLYGYEEIELNVLPRCDSDELLTSIAHHIPLHIENNLLETKLLEAYHRTHDTKWLSLLIQRSNIEALEEYYQLSSSLNEIPDLTDGCSVPYITEAFRFISKAKALPMLVKLLQLTFNPGFQDKEFFGLYSGCYEAIINIGKKEYVEVRTCLQHARTYDLSPFDSTLSDLLNAIKDEQKKITDAPMSFDVALALVPI